MDEYIASAKAHWAPRFTANGVPAVDFERVTKDLQSWDEWCSDCLPVACDLPLSAFAPQPVAAGGVTLELKLMELSVVRNNKLT